MNQEYKPIRVQHIADLIHIEAKIEEYAKSDITKEEASNLRQTRIYFVDMLVDLYDYSFTQLSIAKDIIEIGIRNNKEDDEILNAIKALGIEVQE